jgi:hypothetical protein
MNLRNHPVLQSGKEGGIHEAIVSFIVDQYINQLP